MGASGRQRQRLSVPARTLPKPVDVTARLAAHGITVSIEELGGMVVKAVEAFAKAHCSANPDTEFTAPEHEALVRGGLDPRRRDLGTADPLARTVADFTMLISSSLSVARAAAILRVHESGIRQRLNADAPTLYGFKVDGEWMIPAFVFDGRRLIPGLPAVVSRLDPSLHPVSVFRWFTTPDLDLVLPDDPEETPQIPRSWLLAGHPAEAVAELAAEL